MSLMARTKSGRDPFECLSVVQKSIRRGDEKMAAAYAYELASSSKQYRSMVLNYLVETVIWEDIGPFDPGAVILAHTAFSRAIESAKRADADSGKERWSLPMITGIIALARCRKSRVSSHLWALVASEPLPPVPDFAKDMHTSAGKSMGRGIEHFLANLSMHNEPPADSTQFPDPYKAVAHALWRAGKIGDSAEPTHPPEADDGRGIPKSKSKNKPSDGKANGLFDSHEDGVEVKG